MLKCVTEYDLKYCGDSVEWCPSYGHQHLLMCGSYQLEQSSGSRVGRIELFSWINGELNLLQSVDLESGLLDAKWSPNMKDCVLLAAALSNGCLNIYKLVCNELKLATSVQVCCNGMALAVDWSTGVRPDSQPKLVVSQSNGAVSIVQLNPDCSLVVTETFKCHDYEAWTAAFNYWKTDIIYTGGDDCKLKMYDTRQSLKKPVHTDSSHSVGITSLMTNQKYEGYLASASYEDVRIWKSSLDHLQCVDKEEMAGGSWRVKWNTAANCRHVAIAAMHNGFNVIIYPETTNNISESFGSNKVKIDYKEPHSSLGYGIDWAYKEQSVIAACSFYDKKLSVATLQT